MSTMIIRPEPRGRWSIGKRDTVEQMDIRGTEMDTGRREHRGRVGQRAFY